MSTRWFRSLRTEGTIILVAFAAALVISYGWAALSALRETTAGVAARRFEETLVDGALLGDSRGRPRGLQV